MDLTLQTLAEPGHVEVFAKASAFPAIADLLMREAALSKVSSAMPWITDEFGERAMIATYLLACPAATISKADIIRS